MIQTVTDVPAGTAIACDIAIIGGGPAGIAMALRLAASGRQVAVLEAGGHALDPAQQALAAGETSGLPYFDLAETRYRLLGGSTFRWGARTAPLKAIDFAARDWVPASGWPIARSALDGYYEAAYELIGVHQPFAYDGDVWQDLGGQPPAFDPARLEYVAFQFGRSLLFGDVHRAALERAGTVNVLLEATVRDIVASAGRDHVEHLLVVHPGGGRWQIRAKQYVLATGGIENARLLLLAGLGSAHVGCCFMEHPTVAAGRIVSEQWQRLHDACSPGLVHGRLVEVGLALAPDLQRREQTLNAVARTTLVVSRDATQALRELLWNLRHRRLPHQLDWYQKNRWLRERVGAILADPFSIAGNLLRHARGRPKRFKADAVHLEVRIEQAPHRDSRVVLGETTDALGQRRAHLHWALTPQDRHTMQVAARVFGAELGRLGLGRLEPDPALAGDAPTYPAGMVGGHHHMGTTRMAATAHDGVVDAHAKVHGVDNLHVAGTSVFPTSGYVNPTATMLALALRLADHLAAMTR